jgi:FkbM family methyltransferase
VPKFLRPSSPEPLIRLGTDYGGWWIPAATPPGTVAYCAGAGLDISFDKALLARGCYVTTFDPTPAAIAHIEAENIRDGHFRFVPVGWWSNDDELWFAAPAIRPGAQRVSHSAVIDRGGDGGFHAKVNSVRALMKELGDDVVDLIKMDIEGAEYRVIGDLLEHGPLPTVLCVEFDQPHPLRETLRTVRSLRGAGYVLARIDGLNYTFIRREGANAAERGS